MRPVREWSEMRCDCNAQCLPAWGARCMRRRASHQPELSMATAAPVPTSSSTCEGAFRYTLHGRQPAGQCRAGCCSVPSLGAIHPDHQGFNADLHAPSTLLGSMYQWQRHVGAPALSRRQRRRHMVTWLAGNERRTGQRAGSRQVHEPPLAATVCDPWVSSGALTCPCRRRR